MAPRIVKINFRLRWTDQGPNPHYSYSTSPLPVNLQVNREARQVALEYYRVCFATNSSNGRTFEQDHTLRHKQIYFSYDLDTAYFGRDSRNALGRFRSLVDELKATDLENIQSIAVQIRYGGIPDIKTYDVLHQARRFPKLREIIFTDAEAESMNDMIPCESILLDRLARYGTDPFENARRLDPGWKEPQVRYMRKRGPL
jgi:hypothetical protein